MTAKSQKKIKVLVIDDDDDLRDVLIRFLANEKCEVFSAADGQHGYESYRQHAVDVVLTDVQLPDISGLDVLARIRESDPHTAVIVLTGHGDMSTVLKALKLNADDFLTKPVELKLLKVAIDKILDRQSLEKKLASRTRKLEKALLEVNHSREFLESLYQTIPSAIITYDVEGKITHWNAEAQKITGVDESGAIGKKVMEVFHIAEHLIKSENTQPVSNRMTRILNSKEKNIFINRNARRLLDADGQWIGGIESFLDVTRKINRDGLLQKRYLQVQALNEISRRITSSQDLSSLLSEVCHYLVDSFFWQSQITIFFKDEESNDMVLQAIAGQYASQIAEKYPLGFRQDCGVGILGHVYRTASMYYTKNVRKDPFFSIGTLKDVVSELAIPIKFGGRVLGIINLENTVALKFDDVDISLLETISEYIGIGAHRLKLMSKVRSQNRELEKRAGELRTALLNVEENNRIIEHQNSRMLDDLRKAAEFQKSLLPHSFPKRKDIKFDAVFLPSNKLGGDFYDVFRIDDQHTAFLVADASGHGVASAMLTAMFKMTLQKYKKELYNPQEVLTRLNEDFCHVLNKGDFFTAFYAVFNHKDKILTYGNASHPRPHFLFSNGRPLQQLDTNGFLLGVMKDGIHYEQKTMKIESPARLLVYTDGVVEAMNKDHLHYGVSRLQECNTAFRDLPAREFLENTVESVRSFCGSAEFRDDFSMLLVDFVA